jgi:hypothetical protein
MTYGNDASDFAGWGIMERTKKERCQNWQTFVKKTFLGIFHFKDQMVLYIHAIALFCRIKTLPASKGEGWRIFSPPGLKRVDDIARLSQKYQRLNSENVLCSVLSANKTFFFFWGGGGTTNCIYAKDFVSHQESILRLVNLQLHRLRCSRLEGFSK